MDGNAVKVLIVDDDVNILEVLKMYLGNSGYDIRSCSDGREVQEIFPDYKPNLVILDIMMPVMDGYQALVGIRNLEKQRNVPEDKAVKVIMTTALNEERNVKMAFELGCTIYSGKPIDQDRFEQALKKLNLI